MACGGSKPSDRGVGSLRTTIPPSGGRRSDAGFGAAYRRLLALACALLSLPLLSACGMRTMVRGQVVDASNGQPIEGAVVAVVWYAREFSSLFIPLDGGGYVLDRHSEMTDSEGWFSVPDYYGYIGKEMTMGVYRKGFVCWSNRLIFDQSSNESKRRVFQLKDNVLIEIEQITGELSIEKHASFTSLLGDLIGSEKFAEATKEEERILYDYMRRIKQ